MASQLQSYAMKCSVCGSPLRVTPDVGRFVCANCGSELSVERGGGTISLKPVTEAISRVQAGTDKTAAELALKRLQEELQRLDLQRAQVEALFGQQVGNESNSALVTPITVGVICALLGLAAAIATQQGLYLFAGIGIGIVVGIVAFFIVNKKHNENISALSVSLGKELQLIDSRIRQTRQGIAKNRAIADS